MYSAHDADQNEHDHDVENELAVGLNDGADDGCQHVGSIEKDHWQQLCGWSRGHAVTMLRLPGLWQELPLRRLTGILCAAS
jgi:hypothetical protein